MTALRPPFARCAAFLLGATLLHPIAHAKEMADWYPFEPDVDYTQPSLIGMEDWAEPAGIHGRVERRGDKLFYNGEEFKFWGTNTGYSSSKPSNEEAKQKAALFKRFGYNALRHHKHLDGPGWQGFQSENSFVEFEPEGLDRFDYYNKQLKDAGVFILHSPTFGVRYGPGDLDRIPFHGDFGSNFRNNRIRAPHGAVYLSEELQNLQIEQTVKFLEHENPYTGLSYAEDPFVFAVELFNEDAVLFFGTNGVLRQSKLLRDRAARDFSAWLEKKYGSDDALREAWGPGMLISDPQNITDTHLRGLVGMSEVRGAVEPESLGGGTVVPWASPWFIDAAVTPGSAQEPLKQRLLDTAVFMTGLQDQFYDRFIAAIRKTGFDGEIVTSNWQAGSTVGHLLNLYSDAKTGIVDRHNYFGGGRGAMNNGRPFADAALVSQPGSGTLSAGFQQVDDAAFMISEWTHVQPNEWYAEGPVILGAYGWGLQGWDVSYNFAFGASAGGAYSERIGKNPWDITNPAIMATMPVVSRMVRRLDVTESPTTHHLNVHIPSVTEGKMSFRGDTVQQHDVKTFTTDKVPPEALAAMRVAIDFTEDYQETKPFDLQPFMEGETIVSNTGELRWQAGDDTKSGYVLIDTDATKGFVGFAPGSESFDLGDGFWIRPETGFAIILMSAKGENETLADAREIVLVAMARARNTGMEFNEEGNRVLEKGAAPLLLEPVKAQLALPFSGTLEVLNHDGTQITGKRTFTQKTAINGAEDQTPLYRFVR